MFWNMPILWILVLVTIGLFAVRYYYREYFGDTELTNLYHNVHFMDKLAQERVAMNNDGPGADHGTPRDRAMLESLYHYRGKTRDEIMKMIRESRHPPVPPTLYTSNPILGIPSHPGAIHPEIA